MTWRLVIVVLVAALSGCGSNDEPATTGDSSSLEGWAEALCMSVTDWQASIQSTAKMANSKSDFAEAEAAVTSANDFLVGSLEGLGTPPAPASMEAKTAIDKLSADLQSEAGEIEQSVFGVSTQSEIVAATARVKTSISKMNADISETVTELKALPNEEGWKEAFRVPECQSVATD